MMKKRKDNNMIIFYILAGLWVVLDQLTKYLIVQYVAVGEVVTVVPHFVSITHVRNSGAAWSILEHQMSLFYIITILVVGILIYTLHKEQKGSPILKTGISCLIGGALGNFIDRLHLKYVIDMIRLEFIHFPIFNIADTALTIGVMIVIMYMILDEYSGSKQRKVEES